MWTRFAYWLRGIPAKASVLLASWKTSVALMMVAALYYLLLAIWARSSPSQIVQNIAGLLPFWAVYVLLVLNTAWCLWRRLPALLRDVKRQPAFEGALARWEWPTPDTTSVEQAAERVRKLGYKVERREAEVWGVRRRWAALGTYLFHCAFFLLAIGFLTTAYLRDEYKVWVAVGEEFTGERDQVLSREPPKLTWMGMPEARFSVEEIVPEFWRDQLLFTSLSARMRMPGGGQRTTRINWPQWLGFGTFLRLSGFGYAVRYELLGREGEVLESSFAKLNVFPPGQRDSIALRDFPHRVYLEVFPDFVEQNGVPGTRSFALTNPAFAVQVYRGKVDLGARLLKLSEPMPVEDLVLRIPEIRYWGEFALLRDDGAPFVMLGFALALAGLALKLRGTRAEVQWKDGTLRGYGAAEPPEGRA